MFTARRLTTTALLALTLALSYLATTATAGAMPTPPPLEDTPLPSPPPATTVVNHTGSPVWTYLVVALAAAVLSLAMAWAVTRLRHARAHDVSASATSPDEAHFPLLQDHSPAAAAQAPMPR